MAIDKYPEFRTNLKKLFSGCDPCNVTFDWDEEEETDEDLITIELVHGAIYDTRTIRVKDLYEQYRWRGKKCTALWSPIHKCDQGV